LFFIEKANQKKSQRNDKQKRIRKKGEERITFKETGSQLSQRKHKLKKTEKKGKKIG